METKRGERYFVASFANTLLREFVLTLANVSNHGRSVCVVGDALYRNSLSLSLSLSLSAFLLSYPLPSFRHSSPIFRVLVIMYIWTDAIYVLGWWYKYCLITSIFCLSVHISGGTDFFFFFFNMKNWDSLSLFFVFIWPKQKFCLSLLGDGYSRTTVWFCLWHAGCLCMFYETQRCMNTVYVYDTCLLCPFMTVCKKSRAFLLLLLFFLLLFPCLWMLLCIRKWTI